MENKYHELFQPVSIGKMTVKNRISMPPMYTMYASAFGEVTERMIRYFVRRAKGGVGMIVLENTCIDWDYGRVDGGRPVAIHQDWFIPELHRLAESVQRHSVKILTQLQHVGRQTFRSNIDGRQPLAPSAVQSKVGGDMPRAMTEEEIEKAIQDYAKAAARSKEAGFDGVELHGAHGYLISQFLSPLTNKRTDKWGGSFDNRCRFAKSVMRAVRKTIGPDFPLLVRFCAEEWNPGSLVLEEGVKYAKMLENEGADCLDVSGGYYETINQFPMPGLPLDSLVHIAAAVKKEVSVPVIAVGSLGLDPDVALDVVKSGKADMVHFGREILADPDLPNKIKSGKIDEIRKCIRCNECLWCIDKRLAVKCVVNPECGHEFELDIKPAYPSKRFVVVGAGITGMEFAGTAAKRGHRVTLLEKESQVGGLARTGSIPEYKNPEISGLLNYYEHLLDMTGVDLRLGFTADQKNITPLKPDAVFIAAGAVPGSVDIKGASNAFLAVDKMKEGAGDLGSSVCIIGGSGVGLDVGLFLKEKAKDVTIMEMLDDVGTELSPLLQSHIKLMCAEKGIKILTGHRSLEITADSVIAEHKGKKVEISCDSVLLSVGFEKVDTGSLEDALADSGIEVIKIGSATGAGKFMDAIHSGFWNAVEA